jgi:REP element-mobilizing transposase RayT
MPYNPSIHHRRNIRLKGYDYSREGLYFVTMCVQHRVCLFGNIVDGKMVLNDMGKMVGKWWMELPHKFPDIALDTYVVMPNHFHGIIVNTGNGDAVATVGADLRVCPYTTGEQTTGKYRGEHIGSPLHVVIQWFKTMTTNEYIRGVKTLDWMPFNKKLWQRNYYEHIIRNEQSHQNIFNYIIHNPEKWEDDNFFRT